MIQIAQVLLFLIALFFTLLLIGLYLYQVYTRPAGRVKSYSTRYTPSVWTPEQMDYALQVFEKVWLLHYPQKSWKVKRTINNLNIFWQDKRWTRGGLIAAAQVTSPQKLKVWKGPKISRERYRMNYTALPEGMVQLMVYNLEGHVLDSKTISKQYKDVINEIKRELAGQVSNDKNRLLHSKKP